MYQIKETETYAHGYILCRFDVCYVIDPSHGLEEILDYVKERKILGVLVTHAHMDHVDLIRYFDCPIYMHKADEILLFDANHNGYHKRPIPYQKNTLDIRFIKDGDQLPFADHMIKVLHTPGHTPGSLCFLYQDQLFTGDTLFKEDVGRTDLYGGKQVELKRSIKKLFELSNQLKIYPGHDESTTMKHEKKHNMYYIKWVANHK